MGAAAAPAHHDCVSLSHHGIDIHHRSGKTENTCLMKSSQAICIGFPEVKYPAGLAGGRDVFQVRLLAVSTQWSPVR